MQVVVVMVIRFEHAGCDLGDHALSKLVVIMVISFSHAGCGHGNTTLSILGVVTVIPLLAFWVLSWWPIFSMQEVATVIPF